MITVTKEAIQQINNYYVSEDKRTPVRIFMTSSGWGGPKLALALDEPKETDYVQETDGVTFIVDKEFYKQAEPFTVSFLAYGFQVESTMKVPECGGCKCS